ncbi:MAG: P-loop NTPase fold protein [Sulfitobacter sp.]
MTSINDHRTISIEAGYGRGKTFFRERWARQLEAAGECVVQIDARLSDHSGDPVVTFLGALLGLVPEKDTKKREAVYSAGKKILVAGGKAVAKAALREGFDELADAVAPAEDEESTLHDIAEAAGQDLSKAAGELIASQLSAEKARLELNAQLKALHAQITEGRDTDRIIILIDELDRCHPDYAIALLEAMKLVFDQDGFVFVLMVNTDYLERIAQHRFGKQVEGELYLDKFVDLRLKLVTNEEALSKAVEVMASNLPLKIPFGDHEEFSLERTASLAAQLAPRIGHSMRQIERILKRVEMALRIYKDRPIDAPLLVWLAFHQNSTQVDKENHTIFLGRASLSHKNLFEGKDIDANDPVGMSFHNVIATELVILAFEKEFPELLFVRENLFRAHPRMDDKHSLGATYNYLISQYIPDHQAMLDAVHILQVDP